MSSHSSSLLLAAAVVSTLAAGCAKPGSRISGTKIPDDDVNRELLQVMETYRHAVESQDAEALVLMASPEYFEDRGTVEPGDDYGFEKLREVLAGRFQLAEDVRFSMRYDRIRRACPGDGLEKGCQAHVEVQIDASYTVNDARGEARRLGKRDQNELVLEWTGDKWLILRGM